MVLYFTFTGFSDLAGSKFSHLPIRDMGQIVFQSNLCGPFRFNMNGGFCHLARTDILFNKL